MNRLIKPTVLLLVLILLRVFGHYFGAWFGRLDPETVLYFGYFVNVTIWICIGYLVNRLIDLILWDNIVYKALGSPAPKLMKDLVGLLVYFLTIICILRFVFNTSIAGIFASFTALGVIIGFALRNIILDAFMGLAMSVDRPYSIGDWVMIHDRTAQYRDSLIGCVTEVNWRTTRLLVDGKAVILPNSIIGTRIITNFMRPSEVSEFELTFTIDFSVPHDRVLRVMTAALRSLIGEKEILADPGPKALIRNVDTQGVIYKVKYSIIPRNISPGKMRHLVIKSVLDHLQQAGIALTYPKRDIYYDRMPARHLDSGSLNDRLKLLAKVPLFKTLEPDILSYLAKSMHQRFYAENATVIRTGDPGDSMYILVEGLLHVYISRSNEKRKAARPDSILATDCPAEEENTLIRVAQIVPGRFFGEISLLTGEPRTATIIAATDVLLYEITRDHVTEILLKDRQVAELLSQAMAEHRLKDSMAYSEMGEAEKIQERKTVAGQIMGKMKALFKGLIS